MAALRRSLFILALWRRVLTDLLSPASFSCLGSVRVSPFSLFNFPVNSSHTIPVKTFIPASDENGIPREVGRDHGRK